MSDIRDEPATEFKAPEESRVAGDLYAFQPSAPPRLVPQLAQRPRRRRALPSVDILLAIILLLPTFAAGVYFVAMATDRYVSEARFVIRTAAKPLGSGGLSAVLQMAGLSRSDDDVFSIQNFLTSREAVDRLNASLDLRGIYGRPEADFLTHYPSFIYGKTDEEFFHYLKSMIEVDYNTTTGITTLDVQAFRPDDAAAVAGKLLDLAEDKVNALNARIHDDGVRVAEDEVKRSQERMSDAQLKIAEFRTRELIVDPVKSSGVLIDLIAMLGADLAQTQSKLTALAEDAPDSPGLAVLNDKATALKNQIKSQRDQIHSDTDSLAKQLAEFEQLALDQTFASESLTRALRGLDSARQEAGRQQLFLERVVSPNRPDYPMMPRRLWNFATIAALNLLAVMIVWLFRTGFREHAQAK